MHYSLPLYFAFELISTAFGWGGGGLDTGTAVGLSAVTFFFLFLTVLLHEFSHCAAAKCVGGYVTSIMLWPLGGLADCGHTDRGAHCKSLWVSLAGPLTHIPLAMLVGGIMLAKWGCIHLFDPWTPIIGETSPGVGSFGYNVCVSVLMLQVTLFAFNLLVPVYPLDGGCILTSLLMMCCRARTAAAVILTTSILSLCALLGFEIWLMTKGYSKTGLGIFVCLWIAFDIYKLWQLRAADQLHLHPLFAEKQAHTSEAQEAPASGIRDSRQPGGPLRGAPLGRDPMPRPTAWGGRSNVHRL